MATIARHVRVTGLVQGVFFRAWTRQQANELGISGWVRNAPDGSVEGHLEGDEPAVRRLIDLLHRGPASAEVANVTVEEAKPDRRDGFEVRHG